MIILNELPHCLSKRVIHDWLNLKDLITLDKSCRSSDIKLLNLELFHGYIVHEHLHLFHDEQFNWLMKHGIYVTDICFYYSKIQPKCLATKSCFLHTCCKKLKKLQYFASFDDIEIQHKNEIFSDIDIISHNCDNIENITFQGFPINSKQIEAATRNIKNLISLTIRECGEHILLEDLTIVIKKASNIQSLYINYCTINDISLLTLITNNCHNLCEIYWGELLQEPTTQQNIILIQDQFFRSCPNLSKIYFDKLYNNNIITISQYNKNLKYLSLRDGNNIEDESIITLLQTCTQLIHISIKEFCLITIFSIEKMKNIKYLSLQYCAPVYDIPLLNMINNCIYLEYLSLLNCGELTGHCVYDILNICKYIKILKLSNTNKVKQYTIADILLLQFCKKLYPQLEELQLNFK